MTNLTYPRRFFERQPDDVARDLIGSQIVVRADGRSVRALIVETEAYGGSDDPASHAYRGSTPRCAVMFGPPGFLYVYRSYGIHWCMNVVTEASGTASAVLLRAAQVIGVATGDAAPPQERPGLLSGPGNLTRGLGVTGDDNARDCCGESGGRVSFHGLPGDVASGRIGRSPRIGLSRGQERPSRYFLEGHPAVSRYRTRVPRRIEVGESSERS
jgi:DNA-3-methyladenine glycosylase